MFVSMLLPSNPEISLDPHRKTEVHVVVNHRDIRVSIGAVHCQLHVK